LRRLAPKGDLEPGLIIHLSSLSLGRRFFEAKYSLGFLAGMNRNPNSTDGVLFNHEA
jgi:hypothetical protein